MLKLYSSPKYGLRKSALILALTFAAFLCNSASAAGTLDWETSHEVALKKAKAEKKPLIIDMWAPWCVPCKQLEKKTLAAPEVEKLLQGFVRVKLNMDEKENEDLWDLYKVDNLPRVLFIRPDGSPIKEVTLKEFEKAKPFLARTQKALSLLSGPADSPDEAAEKKPEASEAPPAASIAKKPRVTAQLIVDRTSTKPGDEFRAGVHFKLDPEWHIYWHYSGQAGLPTRVDWGLPGALKAGPLQWPAPAQFEESMDDETLTTIGYEKEAILFSTIKVPSDQSLGEAIPIEAKVQWLVCRESCIRGTANLKLEIPVADEAQISGKSALLDSWAAKVPQSAKDAPGISLERTFSSNYIAEGQKLQVEYRLKGPSDAQFSPPDGKYRVIFIPKAPRDIEALNVRSALKGNEVRTTLTLKGREGISKSGKAKVGGVFQIQSDGKALAIKVEDLLSYGRGQAGGQAASLSQGGAAKKAELEVVETPGEETSLWQMLLFAFIGGLLLNIMPCVLPVLSMKVMSVLEQSSKDRKTIWNHGLAYSAGVVVSFWILALFVIMLKASGDLVGWGFQFQNPWFVVVLCTIIFAFALNLLGVFEVFVLLPGKLQGAASKGGGEITGSFMNGAFATLLATPCTAPFLGASMGFALSQPGPIIFLFFTVVALGLASPFILLAAKPEWMKKAMPKPGPWTEHFKQVMGFVLIATSLWLIDVLTAQVSVSSVVGLLIFLTSIAFAGWLYGNFATLIASPKQRRLASTLAIATVALAGTFALEMEPIQKTQAAEGGEKLGGLTWINFSQETVEKLQQDGQSVFIDFTADWCITCKVNENTVIYTEDVAKVFKQHNIATVKADFTNNDETIAQWLRRFKRAGVPLYVILPPANKPDKKVIVLPEILTKDLLIEKLNQAAG